MHDITDYFLVKVREHARERLDHVGVLCPVQSLGLGCLGACLPRSSLFGGQGMSRGRPLVGIAFLSTSRGWGQSLAEARRRRGFL